MRENLSEICYRFFSTLANPTRLAILELLHDRPKNVTEISKALNKEQSMISHNLRILKRCRFVFSERRKKENVYFLNKETMEPLFKTFVHHSKKYCPTEGKCLTDKGIQERRKKEASDTLYLTHY